MPNKFNEQYDVKALKENYEKAKDNGGDYPEVPVGKYEVKVEKIELGATKSGAPMAKVQFRIAEGEFKKSCLFYNQVLVGVDKQTGQLSAFGIHKFNEFLESLDPIDEKGKSLNIKFDDFNQYEQLLLDAAEGVEGSTYEIQYSKKNDFPDYKVLEIYED